MSSSAWDELVDNVVNRTRGPSAGRLERAEVEQVVAATIAELAGVFPELDATSGSRIAGMADKEQKGQSKTYRLRGVEADDGTKGDLVLEVKGGGNVHADFEPSGGEPAQQPAQQPSPEQPDPTATDPSTDT